MNKFALTFLILIPFLFMGCELDEDEDHEETETVKVAGWHFQGRDCLSCHNVDLQSDKHLSFAGTIYKDKNVTDVNDLNQVCGGDFVVKFLDTSFATQLSSADNEDIDSKGYQGMGNVFMLKRQNIPLNGNYYIQITDRNSSVLAVSGIHSFNGDEYSIDTADDLSNRVACNACHKTGGTASPLYAQVNNLCE